MSGRCILTSNSRYYLKCVKEKNSNNQFNIFIEDLFHGLKKPLFNSSNDSSLKLVIRHKYQFVQLSSNRLILFAYSPSIFDVDQSDSTLIYFLEIDPQNEKFKVLNCYDTEIQFAKMMFIDQLNENRFGIVSIQPVEDNTMEFTRRLSIGKFNNTCDTCEIEWQATEPLEYEWKFKYPKLVGQKLCGLCKVLKIGKLTTFTYWEFDLNSRSPVEMFEFQMTDHFLSSWIDRYQWIEDICYLSNEFLIFAFNVQTEKGFQINLTKNSLFDMSDPIWIVNKENVLTIFDEDDSPVFCSLRKPKRLLINVWLSISNQKDTENGQKIYDFALQILPLNSELQQFYFEPLKIHDDKSFLPYFDPKCSLL